MNAQLTLLLMLLAWFSQGCSLDAKADRQQPQSQPFPEATLAPLAVDTATAIERALPTEWTATGLVQAPASSTLSFELSGRLAFLRMSPGQVVQAGDILAVLDTQALSIQRELAEARLARANLVRQDLILQKSGRHFSPDSLSSDWRNYIELESGYREAQSALRQAQLALKQSVLRAPFSGSLAEVKAKPHQQVGPGTELATLLDLQRLTVEVGLMETELPHLREGLPVEIRLASLPEVVLPGHVLAISPQVDEHGLVKVITALRHTSGNVFPGMQAEVSLQLPGSRPAVVVPADAVLRRSGRHLVFVYENGLAKWHYVTLGKRSGDWVEILEGLPANVAVITSQHNGLAHDAAVTINQVR